MPDVAAATRAGAALSRRPGFWLLAVAVAGAHLLLSNRLAEQRVGWGAGDTPPPRIEVAFVRELAAAKPVAVAAPVVVAERRLPAVAAKPQAAASSPAAAVEPAPGAGPPPAPVLAAAEPEPPAQPAPVPEPALHASATAAAEPPAPVIPPVPEPMPALATAPGPALVASAAEAASAPAFEWPPSTRLSYRLSGDYRGPVDGTAQVEWLRQGSRYQVHLSTAIGPVLSRHIRSEGELTAQGLAPRRFDGEQKVLFRSPRRWQLRFGPEQVQLSDGKQVPAQPGAQDEASQFVQLTWLFTTQPQKLKVGSAVEMPLAISRKLERWIYDVKGEELLRFPFGEVATFHLKPRREAAGGDLTPEIWIAPTLQYLPVRIMIRDNQGNWVDLTLETPPLQAERAK